MMNTENRGPIAWMARNHVAANLLMLILMVGGMVMLMSNTKKEVFPEIDSNIISVTVPYPGASPEEVESGVLLAVEEAVDGIDGIKKLRSEATEGVGIVYAEMFYDADYDEVLSDVEGAVDRITTFPDDAEDPTVKHISNSVMVMQFALYGDADEASLKEYAEMMRDDMLRDSRISKVELEAVRPPEISIEVPRQTLRNYGLSLEQVAGIIRQTAVEIPGGEIKTEAGRILLRTREKRDWATEFKDIVVVAAPDGTAVRLGDIATIREGFEDTDDFAFFNGKRAVVLSVYRVGKQTPVEVADAVKAYQESVLAELPPGFGMGELIDFSKIYKDRIRLLNKNAIIGLILVLVLLGLFLQPSLAFWVTMGIPISFLGAFLFLPGADISINMISLFAFIVTLGIVVDDAIVVGENIYEHRQRGDDCQNSSIVGAQEVAVPVVFSVLTTVAAFAPMLFMEGDWGQVMRNVPIVVITVLLISLFECLYILPAHLAHVRKKDCRTGGGWFQRFQSRFSDGIVHFARDTYGPMVSWCVHNRWQTLAIGIAVLIVSVGFVASGRINFQLMSSPEGDWVNATAILPYDAPREDVMAVKQQLEDAAFKAVDEHGGQEFSKGVIAMLDQNTVLVIASLVGPDEREFNLKDFTGSWRKNIGDIPGLESLKVEPGRLGHSSGAALAIRLSHNNIAVLENAASELAEMLKSYDGVYDVDDGFSSGKPQLDFNLTPEGRSLGLTNLELARQVRNAYYGVEAFSQQRGRDTVSVNVKLPEDQRRSQYDVESLIIRTPSGGEIPLGQAASVKRGVSYTSIKRDSRKRIIEVSSEIEIAVTSVDKVLASLTTGDLQRLTDKYPGLSYSFGGEKEASQEAMGSLFAGFAVALLVMYCLVAIPFKSYIQSMVVLFAIPFGFVGALLGHLVMGYNLSLMSMMGVVALSGVVINDSLVLVHTANRMQAEGMRLEDAVQQAGIRRFRPIILTSLTTFLGLTPMILETSIQARFLIPMALSLGFGVLFATLITLLMVPAFYMIEVDVKTLALEAFGDIRGFVRRKTGTETG